MSRHHSISGWSFSTYNCTTWAFLDCHWYWFNLSKSKTCWFELPIFQTISCPSSWPLNISSCQLSLIFLLVRCWIHLGQFQCIHRPKLTAIKPPVVGLAFDFDQAIWMYLIWMHLISILFFNTWQTSQSWSPIFWLCPRWNRTLQCYPIDPASENGGDFLFALWGRFLI